LMFDLMDVAYVLCIAFTTLAQRAKYLLLLVSYSGPLVLRVYTPYS